MATHLMGPGEIAAAVERHGFLPTPINPDTGEAFIYCVVLPNGVDMLFADGIADFVDGLIPGYLSKDIDEAAEARILLAGHAASWLQAQAIATLTEEELNNLDEADLIALLAPRLGPDAAVADWWTVDIPLYVVETSYEPYTDVPRPASSKDGRKDLDPIQWIRPAGEEDLVVSLHEAGFIRLMENVDREDHPTV